MPTWQEAAAELAAAIVKLEQDIRGERDRSEALAYIAGALGSPADSAQSLRARADIIAEYEPAVWRERRGRRAGERLAGIGNSGPR